MSEDEFSIKGRIVELASAEGEDGGGVHRPVKLIVSKTGNKWLIGEITTGNYE